MEVVRLAGRWVEDTLDELDEWGYERTEEGLMGEDDYESDPVFMSAAVVSALGAEVDELLDIALRSGCACEFEEMGRGISLL